MRAHPEGPPPGSVFVSCWLAALAAARRPLVFLPFVPQVVVQGLTLLLLSQFYRGPLPDLVGGLFFSLGGERALHYPNAYDTLPRVFHRADLFINLALGVPCRGALIVLLPWAFRARSGEGAPRMSAVLGRLGPLWCVGFLPWAVAVFGVVMMDRLTTGVFYGSPRVLAATELALQALVILAEVLFAYAAAGVLLGRLTPLAALKRSAAMASRSFWTTLGFVSIPLVAVLALLTAAKRAVEVGAAPAPEASVWLSALSILFGVMASVCVTAVTTRRYLHEWGLEPSERKPGRASLSASGLALLALWTALPGCSGETAPEFERRFLAEREEWRARKAEAEPRAVSSGPVEAAARARQLHAEIEQKFGVEARPSGEDLANPDRRTRLLVAGRAGLRSAHLGLRAGEVAEAAEMFARVGEIYGFAEDLEYQAWMGEGIAWELLGDVRRALLIYARVLDKYPAVRAGVEGAPSQVNVDLLNLAVHRADLAKHTPALEGVDRIIVQERARLRGLLFGREGTRAGREVRWRLAEVHLVCGDWEDGASALEDLATEAGEGADRAQLLLEAGEAWLRSSDGLSGAERNALAAQMAGAGTEQGAEARLLLGRVLLAKGNAAGALSVLEDLLALGARLRAGREAEARYLRGQCLVALGRWEEAVPILEYVAKANPRSPYGILARSRSLKMRGTLTDRRGARRVAAETVELAALLPVRSAQKAGAVGWGPRDSYRQEQALWREVSRSLIGIANDWPGEPFAKLAMERGVRVARDLARDEDLAREILQTQEAMGETP